ncbi:hypothetical protein G195_005698 [Phytophthora kernoviae 00238/432]|uniref:Ubiquitin-conjugating enzyme E2 H n=2 Tax=Phytophthora kernoviae TaxID=325452 RepID=A0A8T0M0D7_9STRA|nr:hypothetical protein G195_005698 [Phytophthora kernoviae 00238/432]KAG2524436.1 hypothetical protein JM16_004950 [Phytophthora kernoviae]
MSDNDAPLDDCEYPVVLGQSLLTAESEEQPDDVVATFGYEFQPASVDKSTPGLVGVDSSNGVQVLMGSSTGTAGGVSFKGKLVEHKDTDCLLIFDGSGFRLERCSFSCLTLCTLVLHFFLDSMMSDYDVHLTDETKTNDLDVKFHGPKDTPYEGGSWKIHVTLPKDYPFKSPSIGFVNRIYHPNVDETSGSVCLDVINQTWSPMFELVNIFDMFIPQLLRYPNPSDPLNGEAASLLMKDAESYNRKVKEYVSNYASQPIEMGDEDEDSDVSDMSDIE